MGKGYPGAVRPGREERESLREELTIRKLVTLYSQRDTLILRRYYPGHRPIHVVYGTKS
jgi:hypothetical protein